MIFYVAEIIHELSKLFALRAGDLIFMGTPAGVAALQRGDTFRAGVDGLAEFSGRHRAPDRAGVRTELPTDRQEQGPWA